MHEAARRAGAPEGAINWMTTVTLEGTQELMKARETAVILATGGMGLVRAAYSAGKPAYGVGPGNAPAYIERTADLAKAVRDIITGKTFDNGLLCSSENSVVVDAPLAEEVKRQFVANGAHFLSPPEIDAVGKVLVTPQRLPNPALVGKPATYIAQQAGIAVPAGTRVLHRGARRRRARLSRCRSKSSAPCSPSTSSATGRRAANAASRSCDTAAWATRCRSTRATTTSSCSSDCKKPAFRIVVNTPTTLGSIGLTTGLDPSMTLGCGGWGGNITSDNISPKHLLNIKRLAYETSPARRRGDLAGGRSRPEGAARGRGADLPKAPEPPRQPGGLTAESLARRIDQFLASRGYTPPAAAGPPPARTGPVQSAEGPVTTPAPAAPKVEMADRPAEKPADFVCEDDVRQAIRQGRKIVIGERSIVTPAARDLAEQHRVFVQAAWPR